MEKAKKNPFLLTLIIISLIVGGGALAYGFVKKSEFVKKNKTYKSRVNELDQMESMEGYPNQENINKLKDSLSSYRGKIEGLRSALQSSTITSLKTIPSSKFASNLVKANKRIKALYNEKGILLPEDWYCGFEKYRTVPAPRAATGILNYQLGAMDWLHTTLADHNPQELLNIYRKSANAEVNAGEDMNKKSNYRDKSKLQIPYSVSMPIQLTFIGYEENARSFLNALIRSNEYLFTIDTIKLKLVETKAKSEENNEGGGLPQEQESSDESLDQIFESEGNGEGGLALPDKLELSDEKLFNQVLGQEMVAVFIDLNLVYFQKQAELPEIK